MRLLGISGSLRAGSVNSRLIAAAAAHFGPAEFAMADLRLPLFDADLQDRDGIPEPVSRLAGQIAGADSVILSTPEYNQSLSGVLKNALDWVSRIDGNPWEAKPVAIMAAASGRAGGARAAFALRLAMVPFRPLVVPAPEVLVPAARKAFDDEGGLIDAGTDRRLGAAMAALRAAAEG